MLVRKLLDKICRKRFIGLHFLGIMVFCAGMLMVAYSFEYIFNIKPCVLCVYQRNLLQISCGICLLACINTRIRGFLGSMLALSFLSIGGVALYHALVEHGVFAAPMICYHELMKEPETIEELRLQILRVNFVPCDKVSWRFLGFSMAEYNFVVSFLLASYSFLILRFKRP